jgi:hypothetical protein
MLGLSLKDKNKHERDQFILFEEIGHIYTIHNENNYISVTTFIKSLFEVFNTKEIIRKIKLKNDKKSIYYLLDEKEIELLWENNAKDASNKGTAMHLYIENYYNDCNNCDNDAKNTNKSKLNDLSDLSDLSDLNDLNDLNNLNNLNNLSGLSELNQFHQFVKENPHLIPYRTEWTIYDTKYKICGSIDMVFHNNITNNYEIYDWKRIKKIEYKSFNNKTAIEPCIDYIMDTNYSHYILQLNLYKFILERNYDILIDTMNLIICHPDKLQYEKVIIPMMTQDIKNLMQQRYYKL